MITSTENMRHNRQKVEDKNGNETLNAFKFEVRSLAN